MKRFRLANIVFDVPEFLSDAPELFYRTETSVHFDRETQTCTFSGALDLCTYFNALPVGKWAQYAEITSTRLHLEIKGDPCVIHARGITLNGDMAQYAETKTIEVDAHDDFFVVEFDVPCKDTVLAGVVLDAEGVVSLGSCFYYSLVDQSRIRPVNLAICAVAFQNDQTILDNIAQYAVAATSDKDPLVSASHWFVVDNRGDFQLPSGLESSSVTVLHNRNLGNAGGVARGMIEALESSQDFTHIVVVDEGARILPESIRRVFNLLSLVRCDYQDAPISGAMIDIGQPYCQYADVETFSAVFGMRSLKRNLSLNRMGHLLANETTDVEVENAYGPWWFCCIPLALVRENGLPLPFFLRCQDLEFGLRCKRPFLTLSGICSWHVPFARVFRASVDGYQHARNMLITCTLQLHRKEPQFISQYWMQYHSFLRVCNYTAAERWLDALEDYLKGPTYLIALDAERLYYQLRELDEQLVPVEEIDVPGFDAAAVHQEQRDAVRSHGWRSFLESVLPLDGHLAPRWLRLSGFVPVALGKSYTPLTRTMLRRRFVAVDWTGERGVVRDIDFDRYRAIRRRADDLRVEYQNMREVASDRYCDRFREMTSVEFWRRKLGLSDGRPIS